jgi:hypothetical protein
MPIDPTELTIRAREHLTEGDESTKFTTERLYALIPSALAEWIRRTEKDPSKRRNFLAETNSITATAGEADVSAAIETVGIQSQFVKEADILFDYDGAPNLTAKAVNSRDRLILGGIQDRFFVMYFFDGKKMFFRNPVDGLLDTFAETFTIRGVCVPKTLDEIPTSVEGELSSILAEIARNFNTEGEHKGVAINMQKQR